LETISIRLSMGTALVLIAVNTAPGEAQGAAGPPPGPVLRAPTIGAPVRMEIDGRRHSGHLVSLDPEIVVVSKQGDSIRSAPGTWLYQQERPCDTSAASEGGAWVGMFMGLIAAAVVDGTWPSIGAYMGSIFAGTTIGTGLRLVDCRRWKRVT
jgi:hypothetical protein